MRLVIRVARGAGIAALFVVTAMLGVLSGGLFAYTDDLPQISALDSYAPSTITRVYADGGQVIGEFAVQRRMIIGYDDLAPVMREAIVAAEDAGFYRHVGVSFSALAVRAFRDLIEGRRAGASTLTQQLARTLFLQEYMQRGGRFEISVERKIKEAILSFQIEKRYTKQEILSFYCNQMYLGHGAYGVEAASRLYFRKSAKDLTLDEAALIAGIHQSPHRQSPYVDMKRATQRRNYVIERMAEEGYISNEDAEAAKKRPIVVRGTPAQDVSTAPYFVEEVRKSLEDSYGARSLYESGLSVQTTLDVGMQEAANRAIDHGLRAIDKRRGWRKPTRNVEDNGRSLDAFTHPRWEQAIAVDDIVPAVVFGVQGGKARLRIGKFSAELAPPQFAWTGKKDAAQLVKAGDLIDVKVTAIDAGASTIAATLEQTPIVEGALVAIENKTGKIRAMVGGYSFARSKFNRAVQAWRQMGSTFKPFLYAAAIDRGFTATSMIVDAPVSYFVGPNQPPYSPHNYDGKYEGPITLRRALEHSRNIPAVRVMEQVGPRQAVAYAARFGFPNNLQPNLSLALGSSEATLLDVTSAYSAFPNQGVRMTAYSMERVKDRDGAVLQEHRANASDALRADTAFVMVNLLRGVLQRGTAASAAPLAREWPLAGKTGTVDDYSDAWFIGFDPDITVGVWVGLDEKKSMGRGEEGARAALPIWVSFMKAYMTGRERPADFAAPGNIVMVPIDLSTGEPANAEATAVLNEAFISGTQPAFAQH